MPAQPSAPVAEARTSARGYLLLSAPGRDPAAATQGFSAERLADSNPADASPRQ